MVRAVDDIPMVGNGIPDRRNTFRLPSGTIPDARNAEQMAVRRRRSAG